MVYHMTIGIITDDIIHSVVVKMSTNGWLSIIFQAPSYAIRHLLLANEQAYHFVMI